MQPIWYFYPGSSPGWVQRVLTLKQKQYGLRMDYRNRINYCLTRNSPCAVHKKRNQMSINPFKLIAVALATAFLLYSCYAVVVNPDAKPLLIVAVIVFLMSLIYRPDES